MFKKSQIDFQEEEALFEQQASFLYEKKKLDRIDNFNEYFDFLNNDYPCEVCYEGIIFGSVQHAYQASRSTEEHIRKKIALADDPMELYELAVKIQDPPNWNNIRRKVMEILIRDKFRRHKDLQQRLKATGNRELINSYADLTVSNIFWGVVDGQGQNWVGRILTQIRTDIQNNIEIENWLFTTFNLEDKEEFQPNLHIEIIKDEKVIHNVALKKKSNFFMGKFKTNEIIMLHKSISRKHAVIIIDESKGVCIIDLGSKAGTFVNDKKIDPYIPAQLASEDILKFAVSTRTYKIHIDYSLVEQLVLKQQNQVEQDLKLLEILNDPTINHETLLASLGLRNQNQIVVKNLPEYTTQFSIKDFFNKYGEVINVKLPIDKQTGNIKRIAFVSFKSEEQAISALKADKQMFDGKRLHVSQSEKQTKEELLSKQLKFSTPEEIKQKYQNYEKTIRKDAENSHKLQMAKLHQEEKQISQQLKQERYKEKLAEQAKQKGFSKRKDSSSEERHKKKKRRNRSRSTDKHKKRRHSSSSSSRSERRYKKKRRSHKKRRKSSSISSLSSSSEKSSSSIDDSREKKKNQKYNKKKETKDNKSSEKKQKNAESHSSSADKSKTNKKNSLSQEK